LKTAEDKQEEIEQMASEPADVVEMFPPSNEEIATKFVDFFQEEVEKCAKSLIGAKEKLERAKRLRDLAEKQLAHAIQEDDEA